jgi:hypothetical protein
MKCQFLLPLLLFVLCLFFGENLSSQPAPANKMSWWYDKPASKYREVMPIATGKFAALVLGKTREEQIVLN